jgi:RNA recognition motif-containing protein
MQNPMIDPSLITENPSTSRVLFADDLGSSDQTLISMVFRNYGEVQCFSKKNTDSSKNYGYLLFENHDYAAAALKEMNYTEIANKVVHLYWADKETKNLRYQRLNTVMLMGLPGDIELKSLHQTLEENFGEIINVHIPSSNKETLVAYVQFREKKHAEELLKSNPITINKQEIAVNPYTKSTSAVVGNESTFTKIYLKNLPFNDETKLKELIETVGKTTEIRFVGPQAAVVILETHEQAVEAISKLNGLEVEGKVIEVQRALTKSEFNEKHGYTRGGYRGRGGFQPRSVPSGRGGYERGGYSRGGYDRGGYGGRGGYGRGGYNRGELNRHSSSGAPNN